MAQLVGVTIGDRNSRKEKQILFALDLLSKVWALARTLTCPVGVTLKGGVRNISLPESRFHLISTSPITDEVSLKVCRRWPEIGK